MLAGTVVVIDDEYFPRVLEAPFCRSSLRRPAVISVTELQSDSAERRANHGTAKRQKMTSPSMGASFAKSPAESAVSPALAAAPCAASFSEHLFPTLSWADTGVDNTNSSQPGAANFFAKPSCPLLFCGSYASPRKDSSGCVLSLSNRRLKPCCEGSNDIRVAVNVHGHLPSAELLQRQKQFLKKVVCRQSPSGKENSVFNDNNLVVKRCRALAVDDWHEETDITRWDN